MTAKGILIDSCLGIMDNRKSDAEDNCAADALKGQMRPWPS